MWNIHLSDFQQYYVNNLETCEVFCHDEDNLYIFSNGHVMKYHETNGIASVFEVCNITENLYPVMEKEDIPKAVQMSYFNEKDTIYLFLVNGDIISIELNQGNISSDIVGSIASGIRAAEWSPELELIALVTGDDTVLVMASEFDPVSEVNLHGGGFGEKQFITVGWGKKETQFRGSEGKLIKKDQNEVTDSGSISDDNSVRISWRGDADYFAVSSINPETNSRYLRIFNREGILQYTSETLQGLEHSLNWRPSGNLIASTQRLPNKHCVCFFEKNGLKHGDFTLPFNHNEVIVKELMWNNDSKLLAILIQKIARLLEKSSKSCIQIYTMQNYHWYHKYTIYFQYNEIPLKIQWDSRNNNTLHVVHKNNDSIYHSKYSWLWTVNKSKGSNVKDEAFVAVINGSDLLLTSFRKGIVPPPMSTYSLQFPLPINSVTFSFNSSNDLLVQLCDGTIIMYKYSSENVIHKLIGSFNPLENKERILYYNFNWISPDTVMCCKIKCPDNEKPPVYYLNVIDVDKTETGIDYKEFGIPIELPIAIMKNFIDCCVLVHDTSGKFYTFDKEGPFENNQFCVYPKNNIKFIDIEIAKKKDESFVLFGLDKTNKFYVNDKIVANNITSFHVHDEFILLTSLKHQLLCINIEKDLNKMFDGSDLSDICTRRIERGSRIVTSVPKDTKVILEMPRGNLECLQPRPLSFFIIGKYLDDLEFCKAFEIMRKQRINLNLIHDHNPNKFLANVNVFIDQIKDQSWNSLFLSELSDEDVTKTMYSVIYNRKDDKKTQSKIEEICKLMEKTLESKDKGDNEFLLPILMTHIKRGKVENIEKALLKVKNLKEKEKTGYKSKVSFNEAFRYILYLIDVEELYKVALGMYDFDLVLLVANKSQKDPKEYLPFLNELRKLETNYQRYKIDKYLKRYEKALEHLMLCDGDEYFNECLTYIKAHKLYKPALKLLPATTDRYKQICSCYGDELMRNHHYEDAGVMFLNCGSYNNAIKAFRKSGNWQEALICSQKIQLTSEELIDLYKNIARDLCDSKKYKEASMIQLEYLRDVKEGVSVLCNGKQFTEAFRIAQLYDHNDMIQTHIKPGILNHYNSTKLQISSFHETFNKQKERLGVVRVQKLNSTEEQYQGEEDLYSETSTVVTQSNTGSRSTARTFRSAKNRRKQERKILSLKEGSPYEDLALIVSLHNIITNCYDVRVEIFELNKCLIKINEEEKAEDLQKDVEKLLNDVENSKSEIWTNDLLLGKQEYGPDATSNSIAASFMKSENGFQKSLLQPKYLIPPESPRNLLWKMEILKS